MTQKITLLEKLQKIKTTAKGNINNNIPITKSRLTDQMRECIATALSGNPVRASWLLPEERSPLPRFFSEPTLNSDQVESEYNDILSQHHLITQKASKALKITIGARPNRRLEEILEYIQDAIDEKRTYGGSDRHF